MDYATFVNIVGKEKVEKFRRMNDIICQENNEEASMDYATFVNNAFHEKYIPKYHKQHIPVSEDGDNSSATCVTK